jgi:hypothetical protein
VSTEEHLPRLTALLEDLVRLLNSSALDFSRQDRQELNRIQVELQELQRPGRMAD